MLKASELLVFGDTGGHIHIFYLLKQELNLLLSEKVHLCGTNSIEIVQPYEEANGVLFLTSGDDSAVCLLRYKAGDSLRTLRRFENFGIFSSIKSVLYSEGNVYTLGLDQRVGRWRLGSFEEESGGEKETSAELSFVEFKETDVTYPAEMVFCSEERCVIVAGKGVEAIKI